jgi:DNA-binding response OmpR family regulator
VVDVYVGYLRKKIDDGHAVQLLRTHRGLGYSLRAIE